MIVSLTAAFRLDIVENPLEVCASFLPTPVCMVGTMSQVQGTQLVPRKHTVSSSHYECLGQAYPDPPPNCDDFGEQTSIPLPDPGARFPLIKE
jgi:hypothetical protein